MADTPGLSVPIGVKLQQFERQMAKLDAMVTKSANAIEQRYERANKGAANSLSKSAAASAQVFERAIQKEARGFDQLKASVDPAYAAQRRYEVAVRQVEAAVRMGAVSQKDANAVLAQAKAAHLGAATAATTAAAQASGFFSVSRQGRAVLMNTTSQVSDMFVQWEMGTDVMRIAGQQLPQTLAGFGVLGGSLGVIAPLLSTIAAIGFPLAAVLLAQGNNAEDSAEKVENFADAWDKAEAAINRASSAVSRAAAGDLDSLREAYGKVNAEVKDLIETLARLELEKALVATNTALNQFFTENTQVDQLFQALDDRQASMADLRREIAAMEDQMAMATYVPPESARILEEMRADLEAMEQMHGISEDFSVDPSALKSIRDARDALQQASESNDMDAMVDAIANMRAVLAAIPDGPLADMSDELALAEDLLRRALAQSERLERSADGIAFDGAAASASRMADELDRAVDAMNEMRTQGLTDLETARIRYEYREDPIARAGALAGAQFDRETAPLRDDGFGSDAERAAYDAQRAARVREAQEIARLNEASRPDRPAGGGSGGASPFWGVGQQLEGLERQIEMVGRSRREIAALTAEYAMLDEAKKRGLDLDQRSAETGRSLREEIERRAQSIGDLTESLDRVNDQQKQLEWVGQELKSTFIDAAFAADDLSDGLEGVAKSLARAAFEAAIFGSGPLSGIFGFGGGGLIGGLTGGAGLGFFARGTDYAPGGAAIVGEEGPELVHLPRGSKVIPNHKLGQSGGRSQVDVFVHPSGEFNTRVQKISGDVAVNVSGQMIAQNNRDVSQMRRR